MINGVCITYSLAEILSQLNDAGKRTAVSDQVPEFIFSIPEYHAQSLLWDKADIRPTLSEFLNEKNRLVDQVSELTTVIRPHTVLCSQARCEYELDEMTLYNDTNHLSVYGAQKVAPLFDAFTLGQGNPRSISSSSTPAQGCYSIP